MDVRRRLAIAVSLILSLVIAGTAGYRLVEGWSWLDSFFMTVTTLSTVGYSEVHPLSSGGKLFSSALIVVGVGAMFYAFSTAVTVAVEGELAGLVGGRLMQTRIGRLRDHVIICGYGRVGQEIAREFHAGGQRFIVVDSNHLPLEHARRRGYLVLEGDATEDDVLIEAGVRRARCLIAASDTDTGNTYITLTAKALNPSIFLVARVGMPESAQKLIHAGADRVVSPYLLAGRHMAQSAIEHRTGVDEGEPMEDPE